MDIMDHIAELQRPGFLVITEEGLACSKVAIQCQSYSVYDSSWQRSWMRSGLWWTITGGLHLSSLTFGSSLRHPPSLAYAR